jgi:hypothetical protein
MQKIASVADEVVGLLKEAAARGHLVILRTAPAAHVDVRTALLMALNWLFKLSPTEARALMQLMQHGQVSREALHAAMSPDGIPVSQIKGIDVVVCKMRKKLAPHGIEIETRWGQGFWLADGTRDRIRKILADAGLDPMPAAGVEPDRAADQHVG